MLSACYFLHSLCSLLHDLTWTTLAATEMYGITSEEFVRGFASSYFWPNSLMRCKRCASTYMSALTAHLHLYVCIASLCELFLRFTIHIINTMSAFCSLRKKYFKDYYNYMQLLAVFLPVLIIPFRAATAWCASTGDGYCVDPTLLPNATNATLDINQACIDASNVQWIIAALAYMANAILIFELLSVFRYKIYIYL